MLTDQEIIRAWWANNPPGSVIDQRSVLAFARSIEKYVAGLSDAKIITLRKHWWPIRFVRLYCLYRNMGLSIPRIEALKAAWRISRS